MTDWLAEIQSVKQWTTEFGQLANWRIGKLANLMLIACAWRWKGENELFDVFVASSGPSAPLRIVKMAATNRN